MNIFMTWESLIEDHTSVFKNVNLGLKNFSTNVQIGAVTFLLEPFGCLVGEDRIFCLQ